MEPIAKVTEIFVYPIKSCRGISLPHAPLTPTGFRWDRNWLVVNYKGRAYTQRVEPKLALVETQLPLEAFSQTWEPTPNSFMVLKAPGMDELNVPLTKPKEVTSGVSVWEWSGSALDEGAEAAKWFSDYLGKPSRLVRFNSESETRPTDPEYVRGHSVMFADIFPYMITSQGSLDALNKILAEPVPINRFRANILVEGCEPFSEDLWTEIKINNWTFHSVRLCSRCKVPTIDQDTGIPGAEPNKTLMEIRSDKVLRPNKKQGGKIYFGQNLVWKDDIEGGTEKMVHVGDPLCVLKQISSVADAVV
ncbi:Molybdenum cofactor sulfurase family protein [Euphorbia peplus]|nr:Molybdenum cofactor sulfurase family protein [Euphorbia peplus]